MNNISRISGAYSSIASIGKAETTPAATETNNNFSYNSGEDQVEISDKARFLSQIADMPDIRQDKVDQIRRQLADGTYDIDGKLPTALDRLLKEESGL